MNDPIDNAAEEIRQWLGLQEIEDDWVPEMAAIIRKNLATESPPLPPEVRELLKHARGKNRETVIEIAEALLPILRKHRRRFKSRDYFAGFFIHAAERCIREVAINK